MCWARNSAPNSRVKARSKGRPRPSSQLMTRPSGRSCSSSICSAPPWLETPTARTARAVHLADRLADRAAGRIPDLLDVLLDAAVRACEARDRRTNPRPRLARRPRPPPLSRWSCPGRFPGTSLDLAVVGLEQARGDFQPRPGIAEADRHGDGARPPRRRRSAIAARRSAERSCRAARAGPPAARNPRSPCG